ncbi:hypothetical protein RFI_12923 [Reticulomyxa filosa]|uniref:Helicase ATP-binding domain-containing protein n=1 Tax=Reticulomyxa filosa TaxID=46433 RepID=X6NEP4_RETFI|nr:hypothetical protein RFI_12923 [Reticulomyxa filosa]|eukprot:ETO24234.1 hypothetical protein RFI_12923 [Reticulomyxa filosa]
MKPKTVAKCSPSTIPNKKVSESNVSTRPSEPTLSAKKSKEKSICAAKLKCSESPKTTTSMELTKESVHIVDSSCIATSNVTSESIGSNTNHVVVKCASDASMETHAVAPLHAKRDAHTNSAQVPTGQCAKDRVDLGVDDEVQLLTDNVAVHNRYSFEISQQKWSSSPKDEPLAETLREKRWIESEEVNTKKSKRLQYWGLPNSLAEGYAKEGVMELYDWQVECLSLRSVLNGGNLVYSAPTGGGKTLVAEIVMLRNVLKWNKKALFVLPFYFKRIYSKHNIRVKAFHSEKSNFLGKDCNVAVCTIEKVDTIILANGIINKLISENRLLETVGVIVLDEMHMIGNSSRGYILELLLTKIRFVQNKHYLKMISSNISSSLIPSSGTSRSELNVCSLKCFNEPKNEQDENRNKVQVEFKCIVSSPFSFLIFFFFFKKKKVVGLSATLPNLDVICKWLEATKFVTQFRPIPLTEYIKIGNKVQDKTGQVVRTLDKGNTEIAKQDPDHVSLLVGEVMEQKRSCLVFCSSKNLCESSALSLAHLLPKLLASLESDDHYQQSLQQKRAYLQEKLSETPFGLDATLKRTIPQGVAFHHAGLTIEERTLIENAFRAGVLSVLTATSTLAAGPFFF